jgi:hypothetical protein
MLFYQKFLLVIFGILCLTSCDNQNQKSETATPIANQTQTPPSILDQQGQTNVKEVQALWELSRSTDPLDDSEKSTAKGVFFDTENGSYMAHVELSCFKKGNQSRFEITIAFLDFNGTGVKLQTPEGKAQVDVRVGTNAAKRYVYGFKTEFFGAFLPYNNTIKTVIDRNRYFAQYFQGMNNSDKVILKPYLYDMSPIFIIAIDNDAKSILALCKSQFAPFKNEQGSVPEVDVTVMSAE